jgi:hypothetical protein
VNLQRIARTARRVREHRWFDLAGSTPNSAGMNVLTAEIVISAAMILVVVALVW